MVLHDLPEPAHQAMGPVPLGRRQHARDGPMRERHQTGDEAAFTWNMGRPQSRTLPGPSPSPNHLGALQAFATSLPCVRMASFGAPVVPPVQK